MRGPVAAGISFAVALALLLPALLAVPAAGTDDKGGPDGKALFEKKCSACHHLSWATDRREWKPDWKEIVSRMVRKQDGWISADEAAAIVDYLGSEYGRE